MKQQLSLVVVASALCLFPAPSGQAQGTIYLSNVGQPAAGSFAVAEDSWQALQFATGPNAAGYTLNSVQLVMASGSGVPSGFTVTINTNSLWPFASAIGPPIATLSGSSNPAVAGVYTYTPPSPLALEGRGQSFYIVLTAATTASTGTYQWDYENAVLLGTLGNWNGGYVYHSTDGTTWTGDPGRLFLFSINASPIPEPSTLGLLALGAGFLGVHRVGRWRRQRPSCLRQESGEGSPI